MGLIDEAQPHLRPELLRISLVAGPSDIQARAVEMVSDRPNPEYFAVLIEGLRTTFGETRQAVEESIATLVGESLTDYDAATRWWSENRGRFDGMLARIE